MLVIIFCFERDGRSCSKLIALQEHGACISCGSFGSTCCLAESHLPNMQAPPTTEEEVFLTIFDYIDRLFAIVRPRKLLVMAIGEFFCFCEDVIVTSCQNGKWDLLLSPASDQSQRSIALGVCLCAACHCLHLSAARLCQFLQECNNVVCRG